ncbi:tRNA(Ile)-lysidine synthase [Yarrowia sp. C11]|nr:tRNA(Ile)-lysidine synthase [Yarrowia sp. C11]
MPLNQLIRLPRVALAVSGGSDSMALAYLMSQTDGLREKTFAYTVDHGVRSDSHLEAQNVHKIVSELGISHRILKLDSLDDTKELSMRQARYSKLLTAMNEDGVSTMVTAHTQDDCIETFVVRMLRGSGLFGLAGIQHTVEFNPFTWGGGQVSFKVDSKNNINTGWTLMRPLISTKKSVLREILVANNVPWFEDPTNQNVDIAERNLVRKMYYEYPEMIPEEFQAKNVLRLLGKLNMYREKCENEASQVSTKILDSCQASDGSISLTEEHIHNLTEQSPDTLQLALRNILSPLSPLSDLSLRLHRLRDLTERFQAAEKFNIAGVDFAPKKEGKMWELTREPPRNAADHVLHLSPGHVQLWDNRFFVSTDKSDATVEFIDWQKHRDLFTTKEELKTARAQKKKRNPLMVWPGGYSFPALDGGVLNTMPK